jgi:hypothetical protein
MEFLLLPVNTESSLYDPSNCCMGFFRVHVITYSARRAGVTGIWNLESVSMHEVPNVDFFLIFCVYDCLPTSTDSQNPT